MNYGKLIRFPFIAVCFASIAILCTPEQISAKLRQKKRKDCSSRTGTPSGPGQKNFGGPATCRCCGQRPQLGTTSGTKDPNGSLDDISMSDPYIYSDEKSHTYYLTGTVVVFTKVMTLSYGLVPI